MVTAPAPVKKSRKAMSPPPLVQDVLTEGDMMVAFCCSLFGQQMEYYCFLYLLFMALSIVSSAPFPNFRAALQKGTRAEKVKAPGRGKLQPSVDKIEISSFFFLECALANGPSSSFFFLLPRSTEEEQMQASASFFFLFLALLPVLHRNLLLPSFRFFASSGPGNFCCLPRLPDSH